MIPIEPTQAVVALDVRLGLCLCKFLGKRTLVMSVVIELDRVGGDVLRGWSVYAWPVFLNRMSHDKL